MYCQEDLQSRRQSVRHASNPMIIIKARPPLLTSIPIATLAISALLGFFVHRATPLFPSTALAIDNVGGFLGSAANIGNAVGNSVSETTKITAGIAGGVGAAWCAIVGGSNCQTVATPEGASPERIHHPKIDPRPVLEGSKVIQTLVELSKSQHNQTFGAR